MRPTPSSSRWGTGAIRIPSLHSAADDDLYELHLAAIEYSLAASITIKGKDDIKSTRHWSEFLEPFEHQVKNLITFCRRAPVALIADDVGLGKTITAGLILSELMVRMKVRRVLILAPKLLLPQWCEELESKFKIEAAHATGDALSHLVRSNVPVVVTTYDSARDRMDRLTKASFDMVILDEAHKLRNLHGTQNAPQIAKVLHKTLKDREFKYVVMLTATPIQNRLWDVYSLIDCLATARGHEHPLGSPSAFAAHYLRDSASTARELHPGRREEFRRQISEYMMRTSRRDSGIVFPSREVRTIACTSGEAEAQLRGLVSAALPKLNALARSSLAESLMSSPAALLAQLRNMAANGSIPQDLPSRAERIILQLGDRGCKVKELLALVAELRRVKGADFRVVVFTRRKETQLLLGRVLSDDKVRVGFITGGNAQANQRAIKEFWHEPPQVNVLVCTDAGAEGVNLQIANIIVNFDLPWNPMVVEQRIGRVQRLGSKHNEILVLNLVVKGSVEETVVARLIAKLQSISETLGDIEAILEATDAGDEGFEDSIRNLVLRSLMGQDVAAATERLRENIERAKAIYEQEKCEVERNLGSLSAMHTAGPSVPHLEEVAPRLSVEQFVERALLARGAALTKQEDGRWFVQEEGRSPLLITFDEDDPDLREADLFSFAPRRAELFQTGRPAFERLVGEWTGREEVRIASIPTIEEDIAATLSKWVESFGGSAKLNNWNQENATQQFDGSIDLRGSASMAHDRYEKLLTVSINPGVDSDAILDTLTSVPWLGGEIQLRSMVAEAEVKVREAVEQDKDIKGFCEFYDDRCTEELERVGGDTRLAEVIKRQYRPTLAAEIVGAEGMVYQVLHLAVTIEVEGRQVKALPLVIVPAARQILNEPPRAICHLSGKMLPEPCLEKCAITDNHALPGLLVTSSRSLRRALPEHLRVCAATGAELLSDEVESSELSGKLVDKGLLRRSAVSGRRALEEEMVRCAFDNVLVCPDEVEVSEVSCRPFRADQCAQSSVSGVKGHLSEFQQCQWTKDLALPTELASSSISKILVRRDLLEASEKNPERLGLKSEVVTCAISGRRLLCDEVKVSSVSGFAADKDLVGKSDRSGVIALPEELVRCEATGKVLLPTEVGGCQETNMSVDSDLLGKSSFSHRVVQKSLLIACSETGAAGLESELGRCSVSGQLVDPKRLVECAATGQLVLLRLTTKCAATGRRLRHDHAVTAQSGRRGHPDCVQTCAWSGWTVLSDEAVKCRHTGAPLHKNYVSKAGYSKAHEELIGNYHKESSLAGSESLLVQTALAKVGKKLIRAWGRKSTTRPTFAVLAQCSSLLGLWRHYVLCFIDLETESLISQPAEVHLREGRVL